MSHHHHQTSSLHDRRAVHVAVAQGTLAAPIPYRLKPVLLSLRTQKHPQRGPQDKAVPKTLTARLTQHPDKTTIGPLACGFDFLGYQFDPAGLSLSVVTRSRHQDKLTQLYERYHRQLRAYRSGWIGRSTILRTHDGAQAYLNPRPLITSHDDITRLLEAYQRRFTAWARGGVKTCVIGCEAE